MEHKKINAGMGYQERILVAVKKINAEKNSSHAFVEHEEHRAVLKNGMICDCTPVVRIKASGEKFSYIVDPDGGVEKIFDV